MQQARCHNRLRGRGRLRLKEELIMFTFFFAST